MGKKRSKSKRNNGSMSNMRSGFKGIFKSGKGKKANPMDFFYILGFLFTIGAMLFFFAR